jgi:chromate transporter
MSQPATDATALPAGTPGLWEIFTAFFGIAIVGFGGVMPWARRMLVEQRGWLTPEEFVETLSLAQFLPGGNIINMSVAVGQRFRGPAGALVAVIGLLIGPCIIITLLGTVYLRFGDVAALHHALSGITAAAAGLILALAVKMAGPLWRRGDVVQLATAVAAWAGVVVAGLPLILVLAVLAPVSVLVARFRRP